MNLILLEPGDFPDGGDLSEARERLARLRGRRHRHVRKYIRAAIGDTLRVGLVNGPLGRGLVTRLDREALELRVTLDQPPPPPLALTLVVALPRPPSMRKVLQQGATMGVKRFVFVHCARTEKSYWTASAREPDAIRDALLLGLEQGRDTTLPEVEFHRDLEAFLGDRWGGLTSGTRVYAAHPEAEACPRAATEPTTLVVGPEGGFIPAEVARLRQVGARLISLGPRILRVETAVVALIARFAPW